MSLVVVGSVALDTVITPKGRRDNAVGGSATFFSLAAAHLTRVKLVGVVGKDFPQSALDDFRKRDIDLQGLDIREGKTFRWGGIYRTTMKERETLFTELNVFEDFSPDLPPDYRKSDFLFLGNIHPGLQLQVLDQMEGDPLVGLDTMNLWISTRREMLIRAISRSHIIIINDEEIVQLTGKTDIPEAVKAVQELGPTTVIVKKGKFGAELFFGDRSLGYPICPEKELIDPTGAGDAFAGGFMGYLASRDILALRYEDYREAMICGTVLASYLVESFSTDTLAAVSGAEISARIKSFRGICLKSP
ncbi:MAG: PfkB family carbohydrate kinase [Candidatus Marinimicrobia bacterium]|nr:PfkB family carbohydrate kinase [Candidatus Neomarinimicrobiota bacterium]